MFYVFKAAYYRPVGCCRDSIESIEWFYLVVRLQKKKWNLSGRWNGNNSADHS